MLRSLLGGSPNNADNKPKGGILSDKIAKDNGNGSSGRESITDFSLFLGILGVTVGAAAYFYSRFKICKPEEYLIRTGLGIADMNISKKAIIWPFQTYHYVNMKPHTFHFNLHNMSSEKVEFNLPVVFTIGPVAPVDENTTALFKKFSQNIGNLESPEGQKMIFGVIEGETRSLTANLTIEQMFSGKEKFREMVLSRIASDLYEMGLHIYNANIKEMSDYDEHNKYFTYRKQRAVESANYEAQVEVAEARKLGSIGLKQRDTDTRITVAKLNTEAAISENERKAEIANSNARLKEVQAEANRRANIAKIEANLAAKLRAAELQSAVELKRQSQLIEQLRADSLTKTRVQAEKTVAEAQGKAAAIIHMANANFYEDQKKAEAIEISLNAHSAGLQSLVDACPEDETLVKFYLGVKDGLYEKLAYQQANAIRNLKPQISVWNTGGSTTGTAKE